MSNRKWAPEIIAVNSDGFKAGIIENTWLHYMEHGWGNGYVALPAGHPWITDNPYRLDIDIHGGITFGEEIKGVYWIGFDTAHARDNQVEENQGYVMRETLRLFEMAKAAAASPSIHVKKEDNDL